MSACKRLVLLTVAVAVTGHGWAGKKTVHGLLFQPNPLPKTPCRVEPFYVWHDPDPFFKDLKQVKNHAAVEYRRGQDLVTSFPEAIVVRILYWPQGAPEVGACALVPAFDPAKVKFRVEWRSEGLHLPADGDFVVSGSAAPRPWCEEKCAGQWSYELTIDSQNISLRSDLVIRIETAEGVRLTEYVGKISTENLPPLPPSVSLADQVAQ